MEFKPAQSTVDCSDSRLKNVILSCIGAIISCSDLQILKNLMLHLFIIFSAEKRSDLVNDSWREVTNFLTGVESEQLERSLLFIEDQLQENVLLLGVDGSEYLKGEESLFLEEMMEIENIAANIDSNLSVESPFYRLFDTVRKVAERLVAVSDSQNAEAPLNGDKSIRPIQPQQYLLLEPSHDTPLDTDMVS